MDITIVYVSLGTMFILVCIAKIICELILNKKDCSSLSHFDLIYKGKEFEQIVEASNKEGKFNSPFIENDNIIDTIISGGKRLTQESTDIFDIFREVGDCDERPKWQKTS